MEKHRLSEILSSLKKKRIAVVGDFFLDEYLHIDPSRNEASIETGLQAYQVTGRKVSPGAAGTIAKNLALLGAGSVYAVTIIGDDGRGFELTRELGKLGIKTKMQIVAPDRVTPTYTKPMFFSDPPSELNRFDLKNFTPTPEALSAAVIAHIDALLPALDAIILMDQVPEANCGVITESVCEALIGVAKNNPGLLMFADSRCQIGKFTHMTIKGNEHEIIKAASDNPYSGPEALRASLASYSCKRGKPVYVTLGENGAWVAENGHITEIEPISISGPIDICGAGDAFTAGTVSALCCGAGLAEAGAVGNLLAALCIRQIGTTGHVTNKQLLDGLD